MTPGNISEKLIGGVTALGVSTTGWSLKNWQIRKSNTKIESLSRHLSNDKKAED